MGRIKAKRESKEIKKEMTSNETGVKEAIQALDNMYNVTMQKEQDNQAHIDKTIATQKERIRDLEERLDRAADFCVSTQEENEQLTAELEKIKQENLRLRGIITEMADERKNYEKERMVTLAKIDAQENSTYEEDKMIRKYLEELFNEKEKLLGRIDALSAEIRRGESKKHNTYSMWDY